MKRKGAQVHVNAAGSRAGGRPKSKGRTRKDPPEDRLPGRKVRTHKQGTTRRAILANHQRVHTMGPAES